MSMPLHMRTGFRGEQLAARYLRDRGYKILAANFSTKLGETDIIAMDKKKTVCFVEVKTRSPGTMLPPAEAVDREKRRRLITNAEAFLSMTGRNKSRLRFDIIEVILYNLFEADINHIKNAFGYDE